MDLKLIFQALQYAAEKHKNQKHKDKKTPFINHPIQVTDLLINIGEISDINIITASILHDVIENTETSSLEIEKKFGKDILNIILEVTYDKSIPKEIRRKKIIKDLKYRSDNAKIIKLADFISNLSSIPDTWDKKQINEYLIYVKNASKKITNTNKNLEKMLKKKLLDLES